MQEVIIKVYNWNGSHQDFLNGEMTEINIVGWDKLRKKDKESIIRLLEKRK